MEIKKCEGKINFEVCRTVTFFKPKESEQCLKYCGNVLNSEYKKETLEEETQQLELNLENEEDIS